MTRFIKWSSKKGEGGSSTRGGFLSGLIQKNSFFIEFFWKYRKKVFIGLGALIIVDILEVIPPIILMRTVDVIVEKKPSIFLLTFALSYLGVTLLQAVCRFSWRYFILRASMLAGRDLRDRYARHLFGLSANFYDRNRVGDLMSLATNDTEAIRKALGPGLIILADAFFYFLTVPLVMVWLSPQLTLIVFVPLLVVPFIVSRNEKLIHERFERVQESFSRLSAMAQENLTGIRLIKAFARENAQIGLFSNGGAEYMKRSLLLERVQSSFGPTLDFVMSLSMVLLLYVGGFRVINDAITLGTFVAFQRYIQKMVWPMAAIGFAIGFFQRAVASSQRMKRVLAQSSDIEIAENPKLPSYANPGAPWKTEGRIEFKKLSFGFEENTSPLLKDISLVIEPGQRVAFVGSIGSGKSVLLSLIPRIYSVRGGMLEVDGIDVNEWPLEELRNQMGYVSQEVFLFSESVVENVAFGLIEKFGMGSESKDHHVKESTRLAGIDQDVSTLVNSYHTKVGERGVNLSGGQKQRLTIARALIRKPSVLILDDALSAVDVETEEKILSGIRSRAGRNTELIAAHRISTIQDADKIVVLEGGRISRVGTHQELIRSRVGIYRKFYEQQRLKEELDGYVSQLEI